MPSPKLTLGPHFKTSRKSATKNAVLGKKAASLFELPVKWTPAFIVVSLGSGPPNENGISEVRKLLLSSGLWSLPSKLLAKKADRLIVRSSATTEDIEARGWLTSRISASSIDDVIQSFQKVWTESRMALDQVNSTADLSLIIQQYRSPKMCGHISNERRVSRDASKWLCECETPEKTAKPLKLTVSSPPSGLRDSKLKCESKEELRQRLTDVASWSLRLDLRFHYEWNWDGARLWVVQRDVEPLITGECPSSSIGQVAFTCVKPQTKAFVEGISAAKPWNKVKSLKVFADAGLQAATLFVLEDEKIIRSLLDGNVSKSLLKDLTNLCSSPIVFRTDRLLDGDEVNFLSPRSETIYSAEEAIKWLIKTAREMQRIGIDTSKICFICHRYIVARSGAFALARPDTPRVLIDSIWGLPDGLLCFSHDSFEVDCKSTEIRRVVRCKSHYLASDSSGKWGQQKCPSPWDWKASLEKDELLLIAKNTYLIAQTIKKPVEVMYFVGVEPETGYPSILPWIHVLELPSSKGKASDNYYSGHSVLVTNEADLHRLSSSIGKRSLGDKPFIKLCPVPDLLRSKEFVNQVAASALELQVPVELEGSRLSHIYYMLERKGVRIRCSQQLLPEWTNKRRFVKLVRDRIPGNIQSRGERARSVQVPHDVLYELLRAKAIEEAFEFFWAEEGSAAFEELADMLEVIRGACVVSGRTFDDLIQVADKKRTERGGFEKGVLLVETENVRLIAPDEDLTLLPDSPPLAPTKRKRKSDTSIIRQVVKSRIPSYHGGKVVIPMIPPNVHEAHHYQVSAGDKEHEFHIEYREKEIIIDLRASTKVDHSPDQLELRWS